MTTRRSAILVIATLQPLFSAQAGAWGVGSFENDGALDWIVEFTRNPTVGFVRATLERVVAGGEVDSLDGQAAIAAAEVVASAISASTEALPTEIRAQAKHIAPRAKNLASLARTAVKRVAGVGSELRDLWGEREESRLRWAKQVEDLLRRLAKHAA